jgi:N6-adenosine-specific RNA methylase IME4
MTDPGIAFQAYSVKGEGRSPQRHYSCTPFDDLAALPVAGIAAVGPYLELFARQQWPGWTCVGDQADRFATHPVDAA